MKNTDGTLTTHIFPYDVKQIEGDKVSFIQQDIEATGESVYQYENNEGEIYRRFSKSVDKGVQLSNGKTHVKLAPYKTGKIDNDFKLQKDGIVYKDIFSENIDIEYKSEITGIKENIIINEYEGISEFTFRIDTKGLIPDKLTAKKEAIQLLNKKTKNVR